jgi:hypothetical protein
MGQAQEGAEKERRDGEGEAGPAEQGLRDGLVGRSSPRWWEPVSSLTAVISLIVVLTFNTLQVKQTREATQLSLLTQLNDAVAQANFDLDMRQPLQEICYATELELDSGESATVRRSLALYDYIAWLILEHHVSLGSAADSWGRRVQYGYEYAQRAMSDREMAVDYPSLSELGSQLRHRVRVCG